MKALIGRILRGLRRVLRQIRDTGLWGVGAAASLLYGALGGLRWVEEIEETQESAMDASTQRVVEDVAPDPVARPVQEGTVAQRVKNALLASDAGRPIDLEFDLGKADHRAARDWFLTLDESGLRALRHMPMPALGAHLHPRYSVRAAGLPRYPVTANANAPAKRAEADMMDFEVAIQARP